ncbi:pentatricopeptide repeat-containing protein [Tanacetum coccineum]
MGYGKIWYKVEEFENMRVKEADYNTLHPPCQNQDIPNFYTLQEQLRTSNSIPRGATPLQIPTPFMPVNEIECEQLYWTGNEIECEQLVWVPKRSGQNVHFNTYVLYKDLGDAYRLFDEMPERNSVSWSVMVGEFDKAGDYMKCFEIFREYVRMMFDMCCDCGKVGDCYF